MGNEKIEPTYTIVRYLGKELPANYRSLILSKWMRSYRYGNDYIGLTDSDAYFAAYGIFITALISLRPDTVVRLAVLSDDRDVVLGFSVTRGNVLDYVHVHKDYRRQQIARRLVPIEVNQFTHLTKAGLKIWATKAPSAKFNPFA